MARRSLVYLLISFLIVPAFRARAQRDYEKRLYTTRQGHVLPYRILYPQPYYKSKKYPVVLVLHGSGERGTDNDKQLTHGASLFVQPKNRADFPAFIVFPQCPDDNSWNSMTVDRSQQPELRSFDYHRPITWPLQAAMDLMRQLPKEERIDKNRLYIMGMSMGGMGTFEALGRFPKRFAAAVPICGGGDTTFCRKYAHRLPLRVFHGSADETVNPRYSRQLVATLQALRADVQYTEYPGVKHNSWDNAFAEPDLLPWLFAQSRKKRR